MLSVTISRIWNLLTRQARMQFLRLIGMSILLSILDLLGISTILFAIATSLSELGINNSKGVPKWLDNFFVSNEITFSSQLSILIFVICFFFITKSLLGLYLTKRIFLHIARYSVEKSNEYVEKLFKLNYDFVSRKKSQKLLQATTSGVETLFVNFLGGMITIVVEFIFAMTIVTFLFYVRPTGMMNLAIVISSTLLVLNIYLGKRYRDLSHKLTEASIETNQLFLDGLSVFREVYLRQNGNFIVEEISRRRRETIDLKSRLFQLQNITKYVMEVSLIVGSIAFVVSQGQKLDLAGILQSTIVVLIAAGRILPSMLKIHTAILQMKQTTGSARNAIELISEIDEASLQNIRLDVESVPNQVEKRKVVSVENLDYEFSANVDNGEYWRISNVNFEIEEGEFLCIFGETGCGKTTLVELMLGIRHSNRGRVNIWGRSPVEAVTKWPGRISYVPQNSTILNVSIGQNVSLSASYNAEKIEQLSSSFYLTQLLSNRNIESQNLGENGRNLSGGERQRIGIARGLYTQPDLLVLDESTNALDSRTEHAILSNIRSKKNLTTIFITHKLENLEFADKVLHMTQEGTKMYSRESFLKKIKMPMSK